MQQKILRMRQLECYTSLSKATIYRAIRDGRFPKPIRLAGGRAVGWLKSDLDEHFAACKPVSASIEDAP